MPNDIKIFLAIIGGTLLLVFGAAFLLGKNGGSTLSQTTVTNTDLLVKSDSHKIGSDSAKVTLVEFSDFECPACKAAEPTVKSLLEKYGDNLRFVYRHFPLPSHQYGFPAAQAAQAAGLQGKFWEMHAKLFEISPDLTPASLTSAAQSLGLNMDQFAKDLDSDPVRQKVLDDQSDGNKLGITATPTFFVNGKRLVGTAELENEINGQLTR